MHYGYTLVGEGSLWHCHGVGEFRLTMAFLLFLEKNNPECQKKLLRFAKLTPIKSLRANGKESSAASRDAEMPRIQYGFTDVLPVFFLFHYSLQMYNLSFRRATG